MKVTVTAPFFDDNGIHVVGDTVEVNVFQEDRMAIIKDEVKPKEEKPKKVKK